MKLEQFLETLHLVGKVLSLRRLREEVPPQAVRRTAHCIMPSLRKAMAGETIVFAPEGFGCRGALSGLGFSDDLPSIPGGYGHFLSNGRGEGFRPGERLKCCPQVAEEMIHLLPKGIMEGYTALQVKPYSQEESAEVVLAFVNPDQLAALVNLFHYRKATHDSVILPATSGCASMFRVPFGELGKEAPRAVVGNLDIFSRPHFDQNLLTFALPGADFSQMLEDADTCFFLTDQWQKGIAARL